MNNSNVSLPGGVTLTLAICALIGATLSIVGFFAHYVPHRQYAQFCNIIREIPIILDDDWQCQPANHRLVLHNYHIISKNVEKLQYLVTTGPWYLSILDISTAWKLSRLRERASRLRTQLIALSLIKRSKELEEIMEMSLSPNLTSSSDTSITNNATAHHTRDEPLSTPPATTPKMVDSNV